MPSLREELEEVNARFMALYDAGDFTGVGNMIYTSDCKFMAPGCATVIGRAEAAKMLQSDYESGMKTLKVVDEEVGEAGGDVVYSIGSYTFYTADGQEGDVGKYVALWKRVDGQLYMYTDIFNSNKS